MWRIGVDASYIESQRGLVLFFWCVLWKVDFLGEVSDRGIVYRFCVGGGIFWGFAVAIE